MAYIEDIVSRSSVSVNPPTVGVDIHVTSHGTDWLWTCFALYVVSTLVHGGFFLFSKNHTFKRTLLAFPIFISAVLGFAYYTMASDLGYTGIDTEFSHADTFDGTGIRQVFYARYVGWFLAWPFTLALIEFTNHPVDFNSTEQDLFTKIFTFASSLFTKVLTAEFFVISYLVGIFIHSTYKWGYFVFGTFSLLVGVYLVGWQSISGRYNNFKQSGLSTLFLGLYLIVWILYPIAWGLSEGGNYIQPDSESVFYGILDLFIFLIIPAGLAWPLIREVDEEFFKNVVSLEYRHGVDAEKSIPETPRHSGDTAVPPLGAPAVEDA
ncbi:plasma membrane heat shock protein [Scheffersomyces amazonensis]|uniref:plasma membrane heat shock protein n=1 Tax=Scheffersomyces amazonensis TaxID=1078765 RepID=UPI00315DEE3D